MTNQRPFQLLIKPVSADCNLRCQYCFYLRAHEVYPEPKRHCMPDDVLERMISGLLGYRFPETVFAWQGGEPTLAGLDFFKRAVELEQRHGVPGQVVGNGMQTNGLLIDDAWCQFFQEYQFLIGLSLDGPKEIHEKNRVDHAGKGHWDQVMAAARRMDAHEVAYNILCVIHEGNAHLGADLVRWFEEQGFRYLQFIPCLEPDMPFNVSPEAYGAFLCDAFDYWIQAGSGRISIRDFDALLAARIQGSPPLCTYGRVCDQYIVVEWNGDVYPCDFFVYPEWRLGNVMDAPLHTFLELEAYKAFAYQKDKTPSCRGCRWRTMCHGGCQKDRRVAGGPNLPSPFCTAYQRFFEHAQPKLAALVKRMERGGMR